MKKNIHPVERGIRLLAGIILVTMAFIGPRDPWFFLGIIPLMTGLSGWCPLYQLVGVSTCKT